jgi:uncharacterized iron-regulated protein
MRYLSFLFLFLVLFLPVLVWSQDKPAYRIFSGSGRKVNYQKMRGLLVKADLVFFGELHNNAIAHWLEFELAKDLSRERSLRMGAEMFETDDQVNLDKYLKGELSAKGFDSAARLWKNYPTDYAPLVNLARSEGIPFVASNVPRRYATLVAQGGWGALDTLPQKEKSWIAPLPILFDSTLPGYVNMMKMMQGHGGPHLPKAQALKDATMAWSILREFQPGELFIHYNGSYHSENHEGIVWYIMQKRPDIRVLTVAVVTQKDLNALDEENHNKADFVICVDDDMTNTY